MVEIANTPEELERVNRLLEKGMPSYRKAYSDRTAWLMACLSHLAYKEDKGELRTELGTLKCKLLETFDIEGTQAMLVSFAINDDEYIALAFRGTEATNLKDIIVAIKANLTKCETGGRIHSGFKNAFDNVKADIQKKIDEYSGKPLFITGHSLGGALATVAVKKLTHQGGIAACYTFGSPRVGNDEWTSNIKTPVYRLVNAADCVTKLPPGSEVVTILSWILRLVERLKVPVVSWLVKLINKVLLCLQGYIHAGNMRYMTNCKSGKYDDVKLLYSVNLFYQIKMWLTNKIPPRQLLSDHKISVYRKKLMVIAERRNPA